MARSLSKESAVKRMKSFLRKYKGKSVLFHTLDDKEKHTYVMVKQYNYFGFLKQSERVQRAVDNANSHRKDGYKVYNNLTEHMVVS